MPRVAKRNIADCALGAAEPGLTGSSLISAPAFVLELGVGRFGSYPRL